MGKKTGRVSPPRQEVFVYWLRWAFFSRILASIACLSNFALPPVLLAGAPSATGLACVSEATCSGAAGVAGLVLAACAATVGFASVGAAAWISLADAAGAVTIFLNIFSAVGFSAV